MVHNSSRFWPGLGGSNEDYAWTLTVPPMVELSMAPVALLMAQRCPFIITFITGSLILAASGTVYALSMDIWMVILSRILLGVSSGLILPSLHTYLGEMGSAMDDQREKQGKKPRKCLVYIAFSFVLNGGVVVAFGATSVIAQFHDVGPYRWPGWFITAQGLALATVLILFFTEARQCCKGSPKCCYSSALARWKLSIKLNSRLKWTKYLSFLLLICCGFLIGHIYSILFSLVTPVLSDQFGFNVEYTSHFLIGLSAAFLLTSFVQLGAKMLKMDNRHILGLCLVCVVVGSLLFGDWQAIGHDPCTSMKYNDNYHNSSITGSGETEFSTNNSHLVDSCEALSGSGDQCFWNPQSRVTGEFCNTCATSCLSQQKSLDIYQFSAGVALLAMSVTLGFVFASAIASDVAGVGSQGAFITIVVSSNTLGRCVAPYWFVESYELTNRHTYFAMAIIAGFALVLLLSLAALYKNLAPRSRHMKVTISATAAQTDQAASIVSRRREAVIELG